MSGSVWASVIVLALVLALALRALSGEGLSFERKARFAAAWAAIILVTAFVAGRLLG